MCLVISKRYHHADTKPFIAQRDVVVWKGLRKWDDGRLSGPYYQRATYILGKKQAVKRIKVDGGFNPPYNGARLDEGLHSFRCKSTAKRDFQYSSYDIVVYPAIIPAGSRVWWGRDGDIVSDALIVYENKVELEKVHGKIATPVPKALIATR